ncbi:MAG: hypothetical protein QM784_25630 [Polyangiaceae bacterium]
MITFRRLATLSTVGCLVAVSAIACSSEHSDDSAQGTANDEAEVKAAEANSAAPATTSTDNSTNEENLVDKHAVWLIYMCYRDWYYCDYMSAWGTTHGWWTGSNCFYNDAACPAGYPWGLRYDPR